MVYSESTTIKNSSFLNPSTIISNVCLFMFTFSKAKYAGFMIHVHVDTFVNVFIYSTLFPSFKPFSISPAYQ